MTTDGIHDHPHDLQLKEHLKTDRVIDVKADRIVIHALDSKKP